MVQGGDAAMLIALDGTEKGRRWSLVQDRLVIGRDATADIVIDDRRVSRAHAEIVRRDGRYFLRDLGSKNGTCLNGDRLEAAALLHDGDEIHVALGAKLAFVGAGQTVPLVMGDHMAPGLTLDEHSRRVLIAGCELRPPLSQAQFRLLQMLVSAGGAVRTRDDIIAAVWPEESGEGITEQAIDALVRRLRERLEELDPEHGYVITVRGHGFRFVNRE
ncbi:MAG: FHA domain-containing protein [Anaerolineae bacterium]